MANNEHVAVDLEAAAPVVEVSQEKPHSDENSFFKVKIWTYEDGYLHHIPIWDGEVAAWLQSRGVEDKVWTAAQQQLQWAVKPALPFLRRVGLSCLVDCQLCLRALLEELSFNCSFIYFLVMLPFWILWCLLKAIKGLLAAFVLLFGCLTCGLTRPSQCMRCLYPTGATSLEETNRRLQLWQEELNEKLRPLGLFCKTQSVTKIKDVEEHYSFTTVEREELAPDKEYKESGCLLYQVSTVERHIVFACTPKAIEQLQGEAHMILDYKSSTGHEVYNMLFQLKEQLVLDSLTVAGKVSTGVRGAKRDLIPEGSE